MKLIQKLLKQFEFSSDHELRETVSAIEFYNLDISKGIKPADAYKRLEGNYGIVYAENVKDFNKNLN